MKILIVEDDKEYIDAIQADIIAINKHAKFSVAKSRDSARQLVNSAFFDLVMLDLKLPTIDGALNAEPEHGHDVFAYTRERVPGTPIFVLTGSSAEPFVYNLTGHTQQIDIWGNGRRPTIQFLPKFNYGDFKKFVSPYLSDFDAIFDIELDRRPAKLNSQEDRLLRIFAKKRGAVKCSATSLSGGLSGVKVLRLKLTDAQGAVVDHCVCKLGTRTAVFDESQRYDQKITRLNPEATPRKLDVLEFGAGQLCGIFYGLAAGYERNAFDVARLNDDSTRVLVTNIDALTAPWWQGRPQARRSIANIRASSVPDSKFQALRPAIPFAWVEEFERRHIQVIAASRHGDLHGLNVLVSAGNAPILIDYGDVGDGEASLDPVTLELSLFFHPDGPLRDSEWPTQEQARKWGDLDSYLVESPMPRFIAECRGWAGRSAAGNAEIAAVAYGYLVRQLKYEDANVPRVLALIEGVKTFFDRAT